MSLDSTRLSRSVWWGMAVVALCLIGMLATTLYDNRQRTLREAWRSADNSVALLTEQLHSLTSSAEMLLALIERRSLADPAPLRGSSGETAVSIGEAAAFVAGGIFTRGGLVRAVVQVGAPPAVPQAAVADLLEGTAANPSSIWVTRPFAADGSHYVLLGRRPAAAAEGQVIASGVVLPLSRLARLVAEPDVGAHGLVAVLRSDGVMLARVPAMAGEPGQMVSHYQLFSEIESQGASGRYRAHFGGDGEYRLASFRSLSGSPLVVNVAHGWSEILAPWRSDLMRDVLFLAVALGTLIAGSLLVGRVAARKEEAETRLTEKSELLEITLNHMDQGLIVIDAEERVPIANQRTLELLDLPAHVLEGTPRFRDVIAYQLEAGEFGKASPELRQWIEERGYDDTRHSYERERPNGAVLEVRSVPLPHGGTVRTFTDITDRKRFEREIMRLAHEDVLTGLPNRASFLQRLVTACDGLSSHGQGFALICLDLDRFKHVNDTLGHPIGDALLKEVARRLVAMCGTQAMPARLGGDEFAVILFACAEQATLDCFAARILTSLNSPYLIDATVPQVSVSGGTALAPRDGNDPESLLRRADLALYEAKNAGRCVVRAFAPGMEQTAQRRRLLLRDLGEALATTQLRLEYQPILGIDSRRVHGLEALVRWDHPARGPVSPADFIPLAEESDLIDRLGEWILMEACREAVGWPGGESIAVNISAMQFVRGGLVEAVRSAVRISGLAPHRLHLEITESALMRETNETIATLQELRSFGPRIVLDDFGTGHSSLSHLCSFPFDRIKIDRSFIWGSTDHRNSRAVIDAIAALGQELAIPTTAEGVETEAQLEVVKAAGCSEVQGYLYARPMRPEAVNAFLTEARERAA